jgi:hypothetical protein
MTFQQFAAKRLVSLAVMVLLLFAVGGCGPAGPRSSSVETPTAVGQVSPTATAQATTAPTSTATLRAPTVTTAAATPTLPALTAAPTVTATKVAATATKPLATQTPSAAWKTFKSTKHHYVFSYPASWTIDIQTPGGAGADPENVNLRPASASLPAVQIYALKGAPPILGFENCKKNLLFRGLEACSMTLPKGQIPATQLLIFQKDASHYHVAAEYEVPEQLGVFDEIVRSFQFVP